MPRSGRHFLVLWSPASSRLPLGPLSPSALPGQCLPSLDLHLPWLMVSLQRQNSLVEGPFFFFFCLISHGNPCFYIELIVHVVQFSSSVMSNFLRPHGLQHTRISSSSPTPRACSNSCPLSHWCHPTISSSVTPFCSCLQSFPASGSLPRVNSSHQVSKVLELQLQKFL